ncbi:hypothetical protein Pan44_03730 [Caulifigura coniformis]|uniref:DUF3352 domain-containing protein n=1 Tax=Caulifigura coniformis TaxID=2527983 RepID=A0A517S8C6_9PLAN|nr:hypothetical protein [Caulifigura coniformis]QDT52363.1 hypothetical protein Pan44_03730 [Caulifigura coniformis]
MLRLRFAAALVALAVGGLASAADSPLSALSGSTDVLVRIKAPKTTVDKAASLVEAVQPGFGAMVRQNAVALGALISNPTLAGVDQSKDWYIAVSTKGQEEPSVVFGVPVTDVAAAQQALGDGMKSKAHGTWLYYSEDEAALPASATASTAIENAMKGEPATVFDKGDIAVYVNLAHLVEAYGDQITGGVEQIKQGLSQIPPQPGVDAAAMQKMYADLIDYAVQGVRDSVQCTIALNVGAEGITFEDFASFKAGSETSKLLGSQAASAMDLAGKMPADAVMIFGASGDTQRIINWGMEMTKTVSAQTPEAKKAMEDFVKGVQALKFGSMVGAMSLQQGDAGLFKNVVVMEVSDAQKYKDLARSMAKAMGKVETQGLKQETTIETDAESYGSAKADVVTVKQEFDETVDPTGAARQAQALMFGPDGIQSRVVYQKDRFITTVGGGKESMTNALKAVDSSTKSEAVTKFRKGLIDAPNVLFLVDVPGLIVQGMRVASAIPAVPLNINPAMLDSLKFEKSFMGFAAAAEKDAVRARTRIPVEQLRSLFSLVMTAQAMQQQQQN